MAEVLPGIVWEGYLRLLPTAGVLSLFTAGFFFHGSQKTQGAKNSSPEKTQSIFGKKLKGGGNFGFGRE